MAKKRTTVSFRETTRADGKSETPKKPSTRKPASSFRETTSLK